MKRFVIGFLVGLGLMYWYLETGDTIQQDMTRWFHGSASRYRDDATNRAAREALGERGR